MNGYELTTDEEAYEDIKELYEKYPDMILKPSIWKKMRLKELKKLGLNWSVGKTNLQFKPKTIEGKLENLNKKIEKNG